MTWIVAAITLPLVFRRARRPLAPAGPAPISTAPPRRHAGGQFPHGCRRWSSTSAYIAGIVWFAVRPGLSLAVGDGRAERRAAGRAVLRDLRPDQSGDAADSGRPPSPWRTSAGAHSPRLSRRPSRHCRSQARLNGVHRPFRTCLRGRGITKARAEARRVVHRCTTGRLGLLHLRHGRGREDADRPGHHRDEPARPLPHALYAQPAGHGAIWALAMRAIVWLVSRTYGGVAATWAGIVVVALAARLLVRRPDLTIAGGD